MHSSLPLRILLGSSKWHFFSNGHARLQGRLGSSLDSGQPSTHLKIRDLRESKKV